MESKFKAAGHAVHPMLIVFPLGLLATATVFDVIRAATRNPQYGRSAHHMLGAGVVGGLVAAVPGTVDYLAIPRNTRARRIGLWHGLGNVLVTSLFASSWLARRNDPENPGAGAIALSLAGSGLALVTGWLGGELVERLAIGVDEGAHENASSSLSERPAAQPEIAA